jgi:hypothetical protein
MTNKEIITSYVKAEDQLVDFFTKSLVIGRVAFICSKLGLHGVYILQLERECYIMINYILSICYLI